jgi:NADH-quinone oxidoreductase subunit H
MTAFYEAHPWYWLFNLVGFGVGLIALLGKLERVPFDIPEAETEIVAGSFTEYSGRFLAYFRMAIDIEMVVGASLLAAVFLPFGLNLWWPLAFALYLLKVFAIIALLTLARTVMARLRIDQMIEFCWRVVAPVAFLQVLFNLVLKGFVLK